MALIVLFGALGCVARWSVEEVVERHVLSHRPYATMAVNALGALVAGLVVGLATSKATSDDLLTGFCGGFTTFSSALAIPYLDFRAGRRRRGVTIVSGTVVLSVVGFAVGAGLATL